MAVIKRTGGVDFPDKLKALVSGPAKSGKTTLLGTIPGIIIADTEPKANNLASLAHLDIPYVTINGSPDLRELLMVLSNDSLRAQAAASVGIPEILAVGIDTMDTLQKIMKRERMESERTTKFVRDDWAWLKEEMTKIIEAFTALPLHVVFTVHLKTTDIGTEDNPASKILPGLEGAIANEIAGMVGYSLLTFRKGELDAQGNKFTKYWVQTEGDETYDFLGTRTGGRLQTIIEPDFGTIYKAAMNGRPTQQPTDAQQLPAPTETQEAESAESGPDAGPPSQVTPAPEQAPVAPPAPPTAPQAGAPAEPKKPDTDPVDEAALQHMKQVYDALSLGFPEAKLRAQTMGEARTLVRMWRAVQVDHAEGKGEPGSTPESNMVDYLEAMGFMPDDGEAPAQAKVVEPKLGGTIPEAKAYVGEGPGQLERANEAFEFERTNSNRKTLMEWLESLGATHGGQAQPAPAGPPPGGPPPAQQPVEQPAQVQTPVQNAASEQPVAGVTPEASTADAVPTEEEATQAVQEGLGGVVVSDQVNADAMCAECGNPIDDPDIAKIALTRFQKILCVKDYISATRS